MITMTGGRATHGHWVVGGDYEVDGPHDARKKTRRLLMYFGADWIKLGATGALSSPHTGARDPQLTVGEMSACVEEAHKCGRKVHAHCYGVQGISNALEAGVDVIVHGQTLSRGNIEKMKEMGTILMPTLSTFQKVFQPKVDVGSKVELIRPSSSAGIREETESNFKNAVKNDIPISMGTDTGMTNVLFGNNVNDLVHMVNFGMTPSQAIVSGTQIAARSIGLDDRLGTIAPGKFADMLVLKKDPTADIRVLVQLENLEHVILNGRFVEKLL
jgi:imidazolonepropionase-like amidohydrolase